jgi:hypothetical protein
MYCQVDLTNLSGFHTYGPLSFFSMLVSILQIPNCSAFLAWSTRPSDKIACPIGSRRLGPLKRSLDCVALCSALRRCPGKIVWIVIAWNLPDYIPGEPSITNGGQAPHEPPCAVFPRDSYFTFATADLTDLGYVTSTAILSTGMPILPVLAKIWSQSIGKQKRHFLNEVKSEDCWKFSPGPHPLRVAF